MVQAAYVFNPAAAFQGMLGDSNISGNDIFSRASEEVASVPFGLGVIAGTDRFTQFLLPSSTGFTLLGVLAHSQQDVDLDGTLDAAIATGVSANVLRKGRVWVLAEETIVPGTSAIFVRHTANAGLDQPGAFRTDADTANADEITTGAEWLDFFAVAGLPHNAVGLAYLDINLPA